MSITLEHFIPIIITVAGGLVLWGIKAAINAIASSITRKVAEELKKHETRLEAGDERMKKIEQDITFIIKTLIERNS